MNAKASFHTRLIEALHQASGPVKPARFTLEFNLRHWGKAITPQAARKWLNGSAIPTMDKVNTLAVWLGVSAEWLLFGHGAGPGGQAAVNDADTPANRRLYADIRALSATHRIVVEEVVATLLKLQQQARDTEHSR